MSHLPLDARAILHYLNELGYRNISATQLKEFLKDLRKLIKYEERLGINTQQNDYYESLFRRTTASYRAKIDRENDKSGQDKRKSSQSSSRQAAAPPSAENRKIPSERNNRKASTSSHDVLDSFHSVKSHLERETKTDENSLKSLIEKSLEEILKEKYSQEFVDKNHSNIFKEKSPIKSIVEEVLKEKISDLRNPLRERNNSSDQGSFKSIIEDIATQVIQEKLSNIQKENSKSDDPDKGVKSLNQDLQQKLSLSKEHTNLLPREPVTHYNGKKQLDSQSLVQELLSFEKTDNQNDKSKHPKKSKTDKENRTISSAGGSIKRLQRSPKKKPEWQDPSLHDKIIEKPVKITRSQSPATSSGARSGRSKTSSSVLIPRPKSQKRHKKPNSDPVALYQYYKNEWEHFRPNIPGESPHSSLRWHVRQRLLDMD